MKEYVKPQLYYENFELTQHIAGSCILITNMVDQTELCQSVRFPLQGELTDRIFENELTLGCLDGDVGFEGYCYTNGADTTFVHSS